MSEEAKEFLIKCIKFYSPSGKETQYANFLKKFLEERGFEVKKDKKRNLIAEKGSGRPILFLASHLDTIPGKLKVYEKDGKIFGRGAVDCKPSLAAIVFALANLDFEKLKVGKVIFAGIVKEETSLEGMEEIFKSDILPDYSVFGEPTNSDRICYAYKGRLWITVKVSTDTGHVASSWNYTNAVEVCLEIWNHIKLISEDLSAYSRAVLEEADFFNSIIANLTRITGGEIANCVPAECEMDIDIRFPPTIKADSIIDILNFFIKKLKTKYEYSINIDIKSKIEAYELDQGNMLIGALRWAIFQSTDKKPVLIKKTGTTFSNMIANHYKIPVITYGPGDPKLEHTNDEYIEIEDFIQAIETYQKFIPKLKEMYDKSKKPKVKIPLNLKERKIIEEIKKNYANINYTDDEGHIKSLLLNYNDINEISEIPKLSELTELRELWLEGNELTSMKGLEKLVKLEGLRLGENQITKIEGLESLVNLKAISLNDNKIEELEGLDNLENLITLNLNLNQISELKGLENLRNLEVLDLSDNKISDIYGLDSLTNLQQLHMRFNEIWAITGLHNLSNLRILYLDGNKITELFGLENLTNLETIGLSKNPFNNQKDLEKSYESAQHIVEYCKEKS